MASSIDYLTTLPNEILLSVLARVPLDNMLHISLVNKQVNQLISTSKRKIMKDMVQSQFAVANAFQSDPFTEGGSVPGLPVLRALQSLTNRIDHLIERVITSLSRVEIKQRPDLVDILTAGFHAWYNLQELFSGGEAAARVAIITITTDLIALVRFTSTMLARYLSIGPRGVESWKAITSGPATPATMEELVLTFGFRTLEDLVDNCVSGPHIIPLSEPFLNGVRNCPALADFVRQSTYKTDNITNEPLVAKALMLPRPWSMCFTKMLLYRYWQSLVADDVQLLSDVPQLLSFCRDDIGVEQFSYALSTSRFDAQECRALEEGTFVSLSSEPDSLTSESDILKLNWEAVLHHKVQSHAFHLWGREEAAGDYSGKAASAILRCRGITSTFLHRMPPRFNTFFDTVAAT